jgi:hypothetical protein
MVGLMVGWMADLKGLILDEMKVAQTVVRLADQLVHYLVGQRVCCLVDLWVDCLDAWKVARWALEKVVMWVDCWVQLMAGLKAVWMVPS